MLPVRRERDLLVREVGDETLVYDRRTHKAHCLNRAAALVWKHCDGRTSVAEIAEMLPDELGVRIDQRLVRIALARLGRARLLEEEFASTSRRDLLRKIAVGAAAMPVVMTILAPPAAAIGSDLCTGTPQVNSCNGRQCPEGKVCGDAGTGLCECVTT